MYDNAVAVEGEFVTFKHVPTRSVVQIVIEAPENNLPDVFAALGYPSSGESLYVAIIRLYPPAERVQHHKELEMDDISPEALNAMLEAKINKEEV